ncbi:hypothetical protein [Mesorhizobium sp. GbtcB19]|uniref:hypothetical protein n=1 Tax=Mesorhizobium sp. GbtcB19 TaxID=2824764 RepID=UPI001C30FD8B|nr:hypothetical protein [Mesorhizobium sp. GbtcB19]
MLRKIIAASALVLAMSGAAMAQSSDDWSWWHSDRSTSSERPIDRTTTGSIAGSDASGLNTLGNTGALGPCASNTPGPDANADGNVNDHYCGK